LTDRPDESSEDADHALVEVLRDDLGLIFVCSCGRWGYTGPNDGSAWTAYERHRQEATGDEG
jgi:hypothetical protein